MYTAIGNKQDTCLAATGHSFGLEMQQLPEWKPSVQHASQIAEGPDCTACKPEEVANLAQPLVAKLLRASDMTLKQPMWHVPMHMHTDMETSKTENLHQLWMHNEVISIV